MAEVDFDQLVSDLRQAALEPDAPARVKSLVTHAVSDPQAALAGAPEFEGNDVILFEDDTVSIWLCRFPPGLTVPPHDHRMRATIGLYAGEERNTFHQRTDDGGLRVENDVVLTPSDVLQIDGDVIHAVESASDTACCGIHVYLGKLTTVDRSLFNPESGEEMPLTDENYERLATHG